MPVARYGVLKGRPIQKVVGSGSSPHYHIHVVDNETDYRVAVNVKSQQHPADLEFLVESNFHHPITTRLLELPLGFSKVGHKQDGLALDYIRGNLFDRRQMKPLPGNLPGEDNDVQDQIDKYVQRAINDEHSLVYAFGERWGLEQHRKDQYFGFLPGQGIHDIHMNQGNTPEFAGQDGIWQDGGLLIYLARERRWVALFLKFQSQSWHTDDQTGHRLHTSARPEKEAPSAEPRESDYVVRIIAALVHPVGSLPEQETVTLLNTSPEPINLNGWALVNQQQHKFVLSGTIESGATLRVKLPSGVALNNTGGTITLLNKQGLKVHGVAYTHEQAQRRGWTLVW